jgi:hypothetical protein
MTTNDAPRDVSPGKGNCDPRAVLAPEGAYVRRKSHKTPGDFCRRRGPGMRLAGHRVKPLCVRAAHVTEARTGGAP